MRWLLCATALVASVTDAQTTSYREGDRMAGTIVASPQGQAIAPSIVVVDTTGAPIGTAANPLVTSAATSGAAQQVQGNVANGATDSGNPVKVGCRINPGVGSIGGAGTRADLICTQSGAMVIGGADGGKGNDVIAAYVLPHIGDLPNAAGVLGVGGYVYDQSLNAIVRQRGDASGTSIHGAISTPVQQGGTIAASGGTAAITFVNTNDTEIVNPSTATLWGSWGTPAVNGANSYPIAAGGSYRPPNRVAGTFTLLSTAANQTYTATRF